MTFERERERRSTGRLLRFEAITGALALGALLFTASSQAQVKRKVPSVITTFEQLRAAAAQYPELTRVRVNIMGVVDQEFKQRCGKKECAYTEWWSGKIVTPKKEARLTVGYWVTMSGKSRKPKITLPRPGFPFRLDGTCGVKQDYVYNKSGQLFFDCDMGYKD